MSANKMLSLKHYLEKLQEAADELTSNRDEEKIKVIHLSGENFACSRASAQLCVPVLEEARARINEKYELKAED